MEWYDTFLCVLGKGTVAFQLQYWLRIVNLIDNGCGAELLHKIDGFFHNVVLLSYLKNGLDSAKKVQKSNA